MNWQNGLFFILLVGASTQATAQDFWTKYNRNVELSAGTQQQDYREHDTPGLTTDGNLDTESGKQNQFGLVLRWQTQNSWLLQPQAERQIGTTDYNGYLQAGNSSLTAYRARTGNVATSYSVQLAYALNSDTWSALPASLQVSPMLQIGAHHWQRTLVQYRETYHYRTLALGAKAQWQMCVSSVLEGQWLVGRTQTAQVDVPTLGFASTQAGNSFSQWHLGISQKLAAMTKQLILADWYLTARYSRSRYAHQQSPLVNGLQAPPNQHAPSAWTLVLQKQF